MDKFTLDIIEKGRKISDGHFTLMGFTTCWKAMFSTPDVISGIGYEKIWNMEGSSTPNEAIMRAYITLLEDKK